MLRAGKSLNIPSKGKNSHSLVQVLILYHSASSGLGCSIFLLCRSEHSILENWHCLQFDSDCPWMFFGFKTKQRDTGVCALSLTSFYLSLFLYYLHFTLFGHLLVCCYKIVQRCGKRSVLNLDHAHQEFLSLALNFICLVSCLTSKRIVMTFIILSAILLQKLACMDFLNSSLLELLESFARDHCCQKGAIFGILSKDRPFLGIPIVLLCCCDAKSAIWLKVLFKYFIVEHL